MGCNGLQRVSQWSDDYEGDVYGMSRKARKKKSKARKGSARWRHAEEEEEMDEDSVVCGS